MISLGMFSPPSIKNYHINSRFVLFRKRFLLSSEGHHQRGSLPPPESGRVNTQQVFGLSNSDLVPEKYEGGLKMWEGSLDLIKSLSSDIKSGLISFGGKRVLEHRYLVGRYMPAIDCYTRAINQKALSDSESSVLFANRAHVNLLLGNYRRALNDAQEALKLFPSNIKGTTSLWY